MEYVPGGTLKERILREGPLDPGTVAELGSEVARALGSAHEKGVIHRDVKPQNVLLTHTGNAKVTDFGIARAANATTTSRPNLVLGTAGYMSPEQAKGEPVGPQSDLYSLGVVLYEMLTGELPYSAEDPVALAMKHVNESPPSPREANPEVPEALDALTIKLLAKKPEDRYASADELADDFEPVRSGLPPRITPDALDNLEPEERNRVYKILNLTVLAHANDNFEVTWVLGGDPCRDNATTPPGSFRIRGR